LTLGLTLKVSDSTSRDADGQGVKIVSVLGGQGSDGGVREGAERDK
jgi:hypothetical protein